MPTAGRGLPEGGEPRATGATRVAPLAATDDQRRRLAAKAKGLGRTLLQEEATIVTPETLLAWHRKLAAEKYHGAASGGPAKPTTSTHLWVNMAEENRDWGYWRIQGALSNLGYNIARSTIAGTLDQHGIEPHRNGAGRPPGRSS